MKRLPPLIELRAFEAAGRHMSFKQAAAELGVTPTAISHQIRLLELYCGRSLFRRRPRPLGFTETGAQLFPAIRDGFEAFGEALASINPDRKSQPLCVTTTNAFASRWLVPRLSRWRTEHPDVPLEVIGTDAVLDLEAGDADIAIRNQYSAPATGVSRELFRDAFWPVCNPAVLTAHGPLKGAAELRGHVLVHQYWPSFVPRPPTWEQWLADARTRWCDVPMLNEMDHLHFREELHAIEAVVAGQGIGICSDVLIANDLMAGRLVKALPFNLPGYGFHVVHKRNHPRIKAIEAFTDWVQSAR
jgi:LysR family transcriptional regulator, glycine cleavage system transcriptional activator